LGPCGGKKPKIMKRYRKILLCFDDRKLKDLHPSQITDEDRAIYSLLILHPEHKEFPEQAPKTDHCSQQQFARLFGISQQRVSQLLLDRVLTPAMPWRIWAIQFISYSKGVATGRKGI